MTPQENHRAPRLFALPRTGAAAAVSAALMLCVIVTAPKSWARKTGRNLFEQKVERALLRHWAEHPGARSRMTAHGIEIFADVVKDGTKSIEVLSELRDLENHVTEQSGNRLEISEKHGAGRTSSVKLDEKYLHLPQAWVTVSIIDWKRLVKKSNPRRTSDWFREIVKEYDKSLLVRDEGGMKLVYLDDLRSSPPFDHIEEETDIWLDVLTKGRDTIKISKTRAANVPRDF